MTTDIFNLIRESRLLCKKYRIKRDPKLLSELRNLRNKVNSAVERAKIDYIKNLLKLTSKDPKRFWRNIKTIIEKENISVESMVFKDCDTGEDINQEEACNYVNDYFANIAERVCKPENTLDFVPGDFVDTRFEFFPPELYEIMLFAEDIDINSTSGIVGINTKICKILLLHVPEKFRMIFANSMFMGLFPSDWATSNVKLLPKAGDLSNPGNWRPISMTNIFSKILEKLVHKQVLAYFLDNNIISDNQFGFLPGKSTHEAIFRTVQYIYSAMNCKKLVGVLLLDVAKAFNCIDHDILYLKMIRAGFSTSVINWFRSYLDRTQKVKIGEKYSNVLPVPKGIAQGTVLGQILFVFYINDIFKCTKYVKMSLFADDCVLYLSGNNWPCIHRKMQRDFEAIIQWTFQNSLRLNSNKTKAMIIGNRNKLATVSSPNAFQMCGNAISWVTSHSYLGLVLDSTMTLTPLLKNIKKRISNKIFMLRKIRKFLTFNAAVSVYKQTILPIIDYAGFLLISCKKEDKNDLQKMQNDILRICNRSRLSDRVSIPDLHSRCKIISLEQCMRKQLLWLMYILSRDKQFLKVPNRVTHSAEKMVFKVPSKLLPVYERSPYYVGTKLWNKLSKTVQEATDIYAFKKEIARLNRSYVKI